MVMPLASASRRSAPDRLAVARIEGGEKILETAVTLVVPVKLLVVTLQESLGREKFPFRFAGKRHVDRRCLCQPAQRHQSARERGADTVALDAIWDQQARAGGRREWNRSLQFGIIAPAGAFIGIGPAAIEHVFALRVRFQIAGHDRRDRAVEPGQQNGAAPSRCVGQADPDSSKAEKNAWETNGL